MQNKALCNVSYCLVSPFLSSYKIQRWASLPVCFDVEVNLELRSSLTNGSVLIIAHVVHPFSCLLGNVSLRHFSKQTLVAKRENLEVIFHGPVVWMKLLAVEEE